MKQTTPNNVIKAKNIHYSIADINIDKQSIILEQVYISSVMYQIPSGNICIV